MRKKAPVVYLTFANIQNEYLAQLGREMREIEDALEDLDDSRAIKRISRSGVQLDDLHRDVEKNWGRLQIFHYAGHAGDGTLRLEDEDAHSRGLAELLGRERNLQLVFLNGCATAPQVELLLKHGVKAVIATSVPVKDATATEFAIRFYNALGRNETIREAFDYAKSKINARDKDPVSIEIIRGGRKRPGAGTEMPWGLYTSEDNTSVDNWRLPKEPPTVNITDFVDSDSENFNQELTKIVSEAMKEYHPELQYLLLKENYNEGEIREAVVNYLPLPIGEEIKRLFTRSLGASEHDMYSFSPDRLWQLIHCYRAIVEFISFILLSRLWDRKNDDSDPPLPNIELTSEQKSRIDKFLSLKPSNYLEFNFVQLILTIAEVFEKYEVDYFITQLKELIDNVKASGEIPEVHGFMHDTLIKLQSNTLDYKQLKPLCQKAEKLLAELLKRTAFLTTYKLATVKKIEILKRRHLKPWFKHHHIELNRAYKPSEHLSYLKQDQFEKYTENASVTFLKTSNSNLTDYLSLSPFILDINAFKSGMNSRLCILSYRGARGYYYRYLENRDEEMFEVTNDSDQYKEIAEELARFRADILDLDLEDQGSQGQPVAQTTS